MNQHSTLYLVYLQSNEWRALCQRIYNERGRKCEMCGASGVPLEMHHKTYERLGHERKDDLLIVCRECHPQADKERAERERRRVEQRGIKWATLEEVEALTMRLVQNGH